jgi:uncharacterized protein YjiS (DUF1127 family)
MNASTAKQEYALRLPDAMSHYFRDEDEYTSAQTVERPGLLARIGAALRWVAELPKRRAVMHELNMLSDHELADIGLSRADLPRVFDAAFVAQRGAQPGLR